jgi:hypothetical protein
VVVITVKDLSAADRQLLDSLHVLASLQKGPGVASKAAALVAEALGAPGEDASRQPEMPLSPADEDSEYPSP